LINRTPIKKNQYNHTLTGYEINIFCFLPAGRRLEKRFRQLDFSPLG
jgi:hypothetical protein